MSALTSTASGSTKTPSKGQLDFYILSSKTYGIATGFFLETHIFLYETAHFAIGLQRQHGNFAEDLLRLGNLSKLIPLALHYLRIKL